MPTKPSGVMWCRFAFCAPAKRLSLPGNATSSQSQLFVQDCKFAL
jgi:hypothetical protein